MLSHIILSEMWLEPRYSVYGANYASGRVLLGFTRGNENLVNATDISKIYDTRRLDFGVRVSASSDKVQEILVTKINEFGPRWTRDFHVYTTIWTSNGFTFLVDGEIVGRMSPGEEGWISGPYGSSVDRKNAPFDQEVTFRCTVISVVITKQHSCFLSKKNQIIFIASKRCNFENISFTLRLFTLYNTN